MEQTITQTIKQARTKEEKRRSREEWAKLPEEQRLALIREKLKIKKLSKKDIEKAEKRSRGNRPVVSYYERKRDYLKSIRDDTRKAFITMYGGICVCCGESIYEFLTIDHIKGQKVRMTKSRESGYNSYKKAISEYRPDLYRVLCMNCNHVIGRYGYCPHQKTNPPLMSNGDLPTIMI